MCVTQSEEYSPLKGSTTPSFLDDGAQPTRYLPAYPTLQPSQSVVTQPGNGEQLAYTSPALSEYYNQSQLAAVSLPLNSDVPTTAPFMDAQPINPTMVSPTPFSDVISSHRTTNDLDGGVSRYNMVPTYNGGVSAMVANGTDQKMMYQESRYDVIVTNSMNRPAARRGPFKNNDDREKTAQTRKIGSCVRCRMQRIRVRTLLSFCINRESEANVCWTVPD